MNGIRGIILVGGFLFFSLGVFAQKSDNVVIKGNTDIERAEYVLSRYLFDYNIERRKSIDSIVSGQSEILSSFNFLTFRCFDLIQAERFKSADSLKLLFKPNANSDFELLAYQFLKASQAIKKQDLTFDILKLEKAIYAPKSFEDSALYYYSTILLAKFYEKKFDAENNLKWNKLALNNKLLVFNEEINYKDFRRIAIAYDHSDIIDSTFFYFNKSLKVAEEQNDSAGIFITNMDLGIFYSERGNRIIGLEYLSECSKYINSVSLRSQAAYHINCNIDYRKVDRLEVARNHLERAEKIGKEINDSSILGHVYQNWVAQYGQEEKLDSIPHLLSISEGYLKGAGNFYGLGHLYLDKGHYFQTIGQLDSVLFWYSKARECFFKINSPRDVHTSKVEDFVSLMNFKEYERAELLSLELLEGAKKFGDAEDSMEVQFGLAEIYESNGNFSKAFFYFKNANEISKRLEGIEASQKVSTLQIKAEQAKQLELELKAEQNERKLLKSKAELADQQKTSFYLFLLVFGISLLLALFLWFSYKLKRTNESLKKLDKQKDDIMQIVAHDLLSPIGKVGALTELLRNADNDKEREEYMGYLDSVVVDSSAMVQNLMDIHAFENNKVSLWRRKVILSELMEDSLIGMKQRAVKKQISIHEDIQENVEFEADGRLIKRIIDNLLGNAIKFSPQESHVDISVKVINKEFVLIIRDQGPGFSSEDKENMFGLFSKLSARPTGEETSTGLGLAIVRELVNQLNGNIALESELGKGAAFTVIIPLD